MEEKEAPEKRLDKDYPDQTLHRERGKPMASPPPEPRLGPSLLFIYFMIGFVLGATFTMVLLSFVKPLLSMEEAWVRSLVISPLVIGGLLGFRVAKIGHRYQLPLSDALKCALGVSRVTSDE